MAVTEFPSANFVHARVQEIARNDPDRVVVLGAGQTVTYAQLQIMVEKFEGVLTQGKVKKGDRIALLAPPSLDFLVAYLAISSYGAIFLGLNPKYTRSELEYIISDSEPAMIFGRRNVRGRNYESDLQSFDVCLLLYDDFAELLATNEASNGRIEVSYEDPCALIYTSGTTGKPKGALIPHGGLAECCLAQVAVIGLERPIVLNNLPINHIGCIGDISAYALMAGGAIVFQEKYDPGGVLDLIEKHGVTWWGQIPTMFQISLNEQDKTPRDLSSIARIFTSGAPAPIALIERLRDITPRIQNGYGMTETVGSITWVADGDNETLATTIGKPIAPYRVRLADGAGTLTPRGETGEVQVKGRMHMLGYWRNSEATAEAVTPDGWLRTGDLAIEQADGNYKLVGRLKEAFKSGGYNVYPREIEQALERLDGIDAAIVVPIPDPLFHEVGYAFLVPSQGGGIETAHIARQLKDQLANYKIPKQFEILLQPPLLPNGKLDRKSLRAQAMETHARSVKSAL